MRVTVASEARSANGSSGARTKKPAPAMTLSAAASVIARSRSPSMIAIA